ncbi:GntR family transcriptional regulator [Streptomyces sp. RKAG337]|uniref:GntR family transcriptional regulator n=1 Tax=Streptomyces sp. RKAG337 TaxID=2893404 RepID=UPI0020346690|nr:GntR family transcriptional regulator [Streptomyces sp. RKAG337]MCM2431069.1 GntR family transcriptional regulator [Streptomyces sp. RKAG337]
MTLPLEEDSRPPYLQAAEVLRTAIRLGEYAPGSLLPSARVLQARFGVASSTVQNALRVLKREGLVYSVVGRGSYVCGVRPAPPSAGPAGRLGAATEVVAAEHDPRPPYVRTADLLREAIRSGDLAPGDRLPSARELQERFEIANSTAQNAVRVLKREGLVYAVQGKGVFVRRAVRKEHANGTKKSAEFPDGPRDTTPADCGPSDEAVVAELAAAAEEDWYCRQVIPRLVAVEVLVETGTVLAFRPPLPGFGTDHIIVVPKQHVRSLLELEPPLAGDLLSVVQQVAGTAVEQHGGCQVLTSLGDEQHNRHLHFHIAVGEGVARFVQR